MVSIHSLPFFISGPCAIESMEQMRSMADVLLRHRLRYIRAQIFKPRTHPDSFQGLGVAGLPIIDELRRLGLIPVIEINSDEQLEWVKTRAGIIQIGARNMQNFELLKHIGKHLGAMDCIPHVLLKRGFASTFDEWTSSALYLERHGIPQDRIILCERGTRSACGHRGMTLDLGLALTAKRETPYAVIVDPSHGTKDARLVLPLAHAAIHLELDGLLLEAHPHPAQSVSDAEQAISTTDLESFIEEHS